MKPRLPVSLLKSILSFALVTSTAVAVTLTVYQDTAKAPEINFIDSNVYTNAQDVTREGALQAFATESRGAMGDNATDGVQMPGEQSDVSAAVGTYAVSAIAEDVLVGASTMPYSMPQSDAIQAAVFAMQAPAAGAATEAGGAGVAPMVTALADDDAAELAVTEYIWNGNGADNVWRAGGEATNSGWGIQGETPGVYVNGNPVIFNDSASERHVTLSGIVAPGDITVNANNATASSGSGSSLLNYGYAFVGSGSIADYTDAAGRVVKQTSINNTGSALLVLNTANTFSGGINMAEGASLYLGCDNAAGTGSITMGNNSTLIVNYHSSDVALRSPAVKNALIVNGNAKITSGIGSFGESRVPTEWRTLSISGGISGSGELSLFGYSYMTKPTQFADRETTYNYVSAFAINERDVVTGDDAPSRFTGTVFLKNEFNYRTKGNHEGSIAERKYVGGALQLTLVDDVFAEACLDLTRDNPDIREAGHNQYNGGKRGVGLTSDNILVLSDNQQIKIKALEADFQGVGFKYIYSGDKQNNYKLTTSFVSDYKQVDERWLSRVVTDGITNLVLESKESEAHVFSGSMGFAHSYTQPTQGYIDAANPAEPEGGSLGVEMLSLEKRGFATQYIHSANLVNLSVVEGELGFNNLTLHGNLNMAGNSVLKLGVTGAVNAENNWESISGVTNSTLLVGSGRVEISSTKQPGHGVLPTTAYVEGSLTLAEGASSLVFNVNSVMPATAANYTNTLLDVSDTLTLWNTTDITLNFTNVNLSTQYDPNQTYYLASADDIVVNKDSSNTAAYINGRTITLSSGYYGSLKVITENGRDYLVMNVVGDPRRTWSGMVSGSYIWQHTTKQNPDDPDIVDARWKENRNYENGLLVLFGNLYQPEAWDGTSALDSSKTVNVAAPLHSGNMVKVGEVDFAIDGVADSVVGYQKVEIVGDVAPASIVIGSNYNLDGVDTKDATNYYFYGAGTIREATDGELHEKFKGGSTGLRKMGNGTVVIATDNSFEGGTVLEGGRIVMQHKNALGLGSVHIINGAVLQADFDSNRDDYATLHAFRGEQMGTTVVQNVVVSSVYVDPSAPEFGSQVTARLSNAHDKKLVLTYLEGAGNTVVTLYGHSHVDGIDCGLEHAEGQYGYAVFKVLNPTAFSGTVRMDGNPTGNDVYRDLWDGDASNNVAGGKVQMEIMTVDKAKDINGGNWLNSTIDLSVENGTTRTVLALDALGIASAADTQIAQVNALHGGGNSGARINSSVLSMSEEKAITLQILGTVGGNYDGVLGFGEYQKTVHYSDSPTGIGVAHHHYGRYGSEGVFNVQKEGNSVQYVNSAWLNEMNVRGGYFVLDEALVARTLTTEDGNHLFVGNTGLAHTHALVVGQGGILGIDNEASADAFAGIGAGVPKHTEEYINGEEIYVTEVAPSDFILFTDGATIAGHGNWYTDRIRQEEVNGVQIDIPVSIDIASGSTVTFNTHNYTPDDSITTENDVFRRYNSSHIIHLLGVMKGEGVHLIFNNELISAAAMANGSAHKREDGLGYEGTVGSMMGYVAIRDINQFIGDILVEDMTVLQVTNSSAVSAADSDIAVTVDGRQAALQVLESAQTQYMNELTLSNGGALLLGGELKKYEGSVDSGVSSLDYAAEGVQFSVTNRYDEQSGTYDSVKTDMSGTGASIGGSGAAMSTASAVHMTAHTATTHEVHDTRLEGSLLELKAGASVKLDDNVYIDQNSVIYGSAGLVELNAPQTIAVTEGQFADISPADATEKVQVSVDTKLELTTTGGSLRSAGDSLIYHTQAVQLQNVNVAGTGLTLQLADDYVLYKAYSQGAEYVAIQIGGELGRFLFENSKGDFTLSNRVLLDSSGNAITHLWVSSSEVSSTTGTAVSHYMLYIMVPEPATATLSLLALAALAARRRRRA